jgi:hypothetical protein
VGIANAQPAHYPPPVEHRLHAPPMSARAGRCAKSQISARHQLQHTLSPRRQTREHRRYSAALVYHRPKLAKAVCIIPVRLAAQTDGTRVQPCAPASCAQRLGVRAT